jgi:hypothetical protein
MRDCREVCEAERDEIVCWAEESWFWRAVISAARDAAVLAVSDDVRVREMDGGACRLARR